MALTDFRRRLCRLIAENRIASGEGYVEGGAALNELLAGQRISRDIDLFHDSGEAVAASWDTDRRLLERHGCQVQVVRERPSYVEAEVDQIGTCVLTQRGELSTGDAEHLKRALADGEVLFHPGRVRGAFPRLLP